MACDRKHAGHKVWIEAAGEMRAADTPRPEGVGHVGGFAFLGFTPVLAGVLAEILGRPGSPAWGSFLVYAWAGLAAHIAHVCTRILSKQIKFLRPGEWRYVGGEVVAALLWFLALKLLHDDRNALAACASVIAAGTLLRCQLALEVLAVRGAPRVSEWMCTVRVGGRPVGELVSFFATKAPGGAHATRLLRRSLAEGMGVVMLVLAATLLVSTAAAAAQWAAELGETQESVAPAETELDEAEGTNPPGGSAGVVPADPVPPPTAPAVAPTFAEVCGADALQPGSGAPEWAATALWDLYFGGGTGLGALILGCPGNPVRVEDEFDAVVYQVGALDGATRGVAISSTSGRNLVVLGEPVAFALDQLERGVAVSGFPRTEAGAGDMYVMWSRHGTTLFVRPQKGAESRAGRYVRLDPEVVNEWVRAMRAADGWLWPRAAPEDDPDGERHVDLVDRSGTKVSSLTWDHSEFSRAAGSWPLIAPSELLAFLE